MTESKRKMDLTGRKGAKNILIVRMSKIYSDWQNLSQNYSDWQNLSDIYSDWQNLSEKYFDGRNLSENIVSPETE